jgi:DNA-binding response OmpR family regulator
MAKILVVEDDKLLGDLLVKQLEDEGYEVVRAADGEEGLNLAREISPDLCLLDVMLPKLDGLSLCRILRKEINTSIILLTARASEVDRVIGLDTGADDYIVKPFSAPELLARVRAALRRIPNQSTEKLESDELSIDLVARRVFLRDKEVKLTLKEFDLLTTLMRNRGAVLTRDFLLSRVWGSDFNGDPRTLDVHIRWLREKIERDPSKPEHLQTVRGVGYRID